MNRCLRPACTLLSLVMCGFGVAAAQQQAAAPDLSSTSLEGLTQLQLRVSSFARKDQDLWVTPAAVFVITRDDIERSAAASVPELLRMVPGVQVAQIDASTWAVSARGFNSNYSDKLLVLIDGRTIYSEFESGAHWDQTDLPLEEIDRIEVIRGPGAAVWGTNAVNGVINIITKRARSTVGVSASAQIGRINGVSHLQYGGSLGDRVQYRGYAFYIQRYPFDTASGAHAFDGENTARAGGRVDWQHSQQDWMTLSGDLYGGHMKQQIEAAYNLPIDAGGHDSGSIAGGYLLGRWERRLAHADSALQFYFDDTSRHEFGAYARTRTFDAEYQDHRAGLKQDLVWGGGFRFTADHIAGQPPLTAKPEYLNYLVDGFAQDEVTLIAHRLVVTLGSKLQQGTLAGFQAQPSGRILWSASEKQSAWAAISRAAVAPAVYDRAVDIPLLLGTEEGLPLMGTLRGNPAIQPETVVAYEAGYRRRIVRDLTVDVASFFNVNRRLLSISVEDVNYVPTPPPPHLSTDLLYTNSFRAKTAGVELSVSWKPSPTFSFQGGYSWMQAHIAQSEAGEASLSDSWNTPRNTITGSASWTFHPHWSIDSFLSFVDKLPAQASLEQNVSITPSVPQYTRLDLHFSHKVGRFTEIGAGGTNLLTARHLEFPGGSSLFTSAYVPRGLFIRAKWSF